MGPREPPSLPEGNPTGERRATRTKVKGRNASSPSVRPSTRIKDWWENIRSDQCGKHDPEKEACIDGLPDEVVGEGEMENRDIMMLSLIHI